MTTAAPTKTNRLDWILRALIALGLGASALLLWDYTHEAASFCREGAGCDVVRASPWASILGLPTPVYGLVFFAGVLVLSLLPGKGARSLLTLGGVAGGLAAAAFILLQAIQIRAFCFYCMIADVAAIGVALIVLGRREPSEVPRRAGWAVLAAVLVVGFGLPFVYGMATRPEPRRQVSAGVPGCVVRAESGPGIAIVVFSDFECPYCRAENFSVKALVRSLGDRLGGPVRIVRKHFPLSQHRYSKDAAKAAICAEDSGRGELMADLLFSTDDLSPAALEAAAGQLGIDTGAFRSCMASPATEQRLMDDVACGLAAGVEGLPTFFIGERRLQGLQSDDVLLGLLQQAARVADSGAKRP